MRLPEQVQRLGIVIGVLVGLVLVVRLVVIPPSLSARSLHRAATVERIASQPVQFAGMNLCRECHEDVFQTKSQGFHKGLACETCHGPGAKHAENPMEVKPYAPRDRKFCPLCHAYDAARPTGFPQINPTAHNPRQACITCHQPHDPVPPETPKECSACHAQIERTKSLSSHALLACTTCHDAGENHRTNPRSALPSKPQNREFCGQCHGAEATHPAAPKIDLASHGGTELCWQCHYPHLPEGRP